jgi:hypothetical protein
VYCSSRAVSINPTLSTALAPALYLLPCLCASDLAVLPSPLSAAALESPPAPPHPLLCWHLPGTTGIVLLLSQVCLSVALLQLLSRLQHPHIIRFIGACLAPPNVCIIEELAEGGSLHSLLYGSREGGGPPVVQGGPGRPVKLQPRMRVAFNEETGGLAYQEVCEGRDVSGAGYIRAI